MAKMPERRARARAHKQEYQKAKWQFVLAKVKFKGLAKNTAHVITLFALSNPWMVRRKLIAMMGWCARRQGEGAAEALKRAGCPV